MDSKVTKYNHYHDVYSTKASQVFCAGQNTIRIILFLKKTRACGFVALVMVALLWLLELAMIYNDSLYNVSA